MISDKNFKLIGYLTESEYNDYSYYSHFLREDDLMTVKEKITEILLEKENCDLNYHVTIIPIFEIVNPNYHIFSERIDSISSYNDFQGINGNNDLDLEKKYIGGKTESYTIKTPSKNIPKEYEIIQGIRDLSLMDDNGQVVQENVDKMIEKLEMLKY